MTLVADVDNYGMSKNGIKNTQNKKERNLLMRIFECLKCFSRELKYSPWAGFLDIMEPKEYYTITCMDCGTIIYVDSRTDCPLSNEQMEKYNVG